MKRLVLSILAAAALSASVMAQELPPVGKTEMSHTHEFVGTIDGCRVWRILYWSSAVFVTRCPGSGEALSQANWSESCGKGCTRAVMNPSSNEN